MNFTVSHIVWKYSGTSKRLLTAKFSKLDQNLEEDLKSTKKLLFDYNPNNEVIAVSFSGIKLPTIPSNLTDYYPNFNTLSLHSCGLVELSRNDLKHFLNLKHFYAGSNQIEELPSDLFEDLNDLEIISLNNNSIDFIGRNVFKHLKKLKCVNLSKNPSFNLVYADESIQDSCIENNAGRIYELDEFNATMDKFALINASSLPASFYDVYDMLKKEEFKDFSIKIDLNEFKVHKFMLIARSPTLAEMIKNNPDADELILEDIEVEVFKIILDYIYEDKMPKDDDENLLKIFKAAKKLSLTPLTLKVVQLLCDHVNTENSLECLKVACKTNQHKLKRKCFEEISKEFPNGLKDELIDDPEAIEKLMEEKALEQMKAEFEKFLKDV